jgi:hypothetical protein
MKSRLCRSATVVCAIVLSAPSLEAATLESMRATVTMQADVTCTVNAAFSVRSDSDQAVVHRLLVGDPIDAAALAVTGARAGAQGRTGRTVTMPVHVQPGITSYEVQYRTPMVAAGRCGLLVPDSPTDGVSRRIEIEVRLAPDARRLAGGFPALLWRENTGRVTLGHVPAFVLAPHANAGAPLTWRETFDTRRIVDVSAVVFVLVATAVWMSRQRRAR